VHSPLLKQVQSTIWTSSSFRPNRSLRGSPIWKGACAHVSIYRINQQKREVSMKGINPSRTPRGFVGKQGVSREPDSLPLNIRGIATAR
jgi:hypothetical protein